MSILPASEKRVCESRVSRKLRHSPRIALAALAMLGIAATVQAQTLTISSGGDTGASGTNWSLADGVLTLTGNASVRASVIRGALEAGNLAIEGNDPSIDPVLTVTIEQAINVTSGSHTFRVGKSDPGNKDLRLEAGAGIFGDALTLYNGPLELHGRSITILPNTNIRQRTGSMLIRSAGGDSVLAGNLSRQFGDTLTVDVATAGTEMIVTGVISGDGRTFTTHNLIKNGPGKLSLASDNEYGTTGDLTSGSTSNPSTTTINAGVLELGSSTLEITNAGSAGTSQIVLAGGTLALHRNGTLGTTSIRGTGSVIKTGGGQLIFGTQAYNVSGTTTIVGTNDTLVIRTLGGLAALDTNTNPASPITRVFDGLGSLAFEPYSASWSADFIVPATVQFGTGLASLRLGKPNSWPASGQVQGARIALQGADGATPIDINGPVSVYGGLRLGRPLIARDSTLLIVTANIEADRDSTRPEDSWLQADRLELFGDTLNTVLNSPKNKVGTLAIGSSTTLRAPRVDFWNEGALVLAPVFGRSFSTPTSIITSDGDITISGDIDITTLTGDSRSALTIAAAAGPEGSGEIIVTGTPTFKLGATDNGVGRFFSGDASRSTGLAAAMDAQFSGNWSCVAGSFSSCTLPAGVTLVEPGLNAIYRSGLFDPAAVQSLVDYAGGADGAVEPTLQTYQDAGISDVIEAQVPAYNSFLVEVQPEDRDEIQAMVDAYNAIFDATGDMTKAADLDEALFDTLAIDLLPGALDFLRAIIGGAEEDDINTHAKLQGLADIANRLWAYASGVVDAELPVLGDYEAIGTLRLIGGNVGAYNSAIRAIEAGTPAEVQTVVDLYNSILDAANGNSATRPGLDVEDYADLGVVVDASALALFEDAIGGQTANAVNTIEKLQQMADAAARIIDAAVDPGNLNPPTAQDFAVLGINGVSGSNLAAVIDLIANADPGLLNTVSGVLDVIASALFDPAAVQSLVDYAGGADGAVEPTLQTYQDAGISDVIEAQVPAYNSFLVEVQPEDRDEIQAMVDAYNAIFDATGDMTKAADLDEALFDTLAIDLLPGALDFLRAIIGGAEEDDINTHAKLQGLADIANRLWAYASGVVDAELPVLGDYEAIGTLRLIGGNVGAYNSAIRAIEAGTPAEVQTVVDLYNSILDAANGNSATRPGLDVEDYADLGVVVDASALALFEDAIGGQTANAVNTIEKLQQMADAAARIIDAAVDPGNLNPPTAQDFAVLGINGVNDSNLAAVIEALAGADLSDPLTVQGLLELLGNLLIPPLAVPTLSFWALLLMTLLLMGLGLRHSGWPVARMKAL